MRIAPPSNLVIKAAMLDALAPIKAALATFVEIGAGMALEHEHHVERSDAIKPKPPRATAAQLETAIGRVSIDFEIGVRRATEKIKRGALGTAKKNKAQIDRQLKRQTGIEPLAREQWLGPAVDAFALSNARKIQSIGREHLANVAQLVTEASLKGTAQSVLAKSLQRQFGLTADKARFLARDQTSKFNAALTQTRAEASGSDKYKWRTSQDERVRPSHARLEGKIFLFRRPPKVAPNRRCNPGEDYNCRCTAEIVIPKAVRKVVESRAMPTEPRAPVRTLSQTPEALENRAAAARAAAASRKANAELRKNNPTRDPEVAAAFARGEAESNAERLRRKYNPTRSERAAARKAKKKK